jgi:polyphosphate kinase 2 (PPK2 family)
MEKYIMDAGIILIKIWLEVGMEEQERRFKARIDDPLRQWKLSPMDIESFQRWYDYSRARDMMFKATSSKHAPWNVVHSDDKRRARLNCIAHLLKTIPHKKVSRDRVQLPERSDRGRYNDKALRGVKFVAERYRA